LSPIPQPSLPPPAPAADLAAARRADPSFAALADAAARRRIQILVAIPGRGTAVLERQSFRADAEYFYPASAVKLCAAVGALEKLAELRSQRAELSLTTPLRISFSGDRPRIVETTLRDEIEKALVVSDNDAFNRLFEFVGPEELAGRLTALGLASARITHRLGDPGDGGAPAFELRASGRPLDVAQRTGIDLGSGRSEPVGTAHVGGDGRLVDAPLDFGEKNRMTLRDLQNLLVATVRPDLSELAAPGWSAEDRDALVDILGRLPSELQDGVPRGLDEVHKPLDAAVKSVLPGHDIRVYGKGGRAYGFTVENSWVVDATTHRSVFVAATIYANDNETINDDRYEYESVADPFIGELGRFVARTFLR
jgi:hypothetical protein